MQSFPSRLVRFFITLSTLTSTKGHFGSVHRKTHLMKNRSGNEVSHVRSQVVHLRSPWSSTPRYLLATDATSLPWTWIVDASWHRRSKGKSDKKWVFI